MSLKLFFNFFKRKSEDLQQGHHESWYDFATLDQLPRKLLSEQQANDFKGNEC